MIEFDEVSNPRYVEDNRIMLDIIIEGDETVFVASPNDCEEHGKKLYQRAIDGEFGEIIPYVFVRNIEEELQECIDSRKLAYQNEADGLFFGYQRGENTKEEWEAKIAEIKARYPKP